MTKIGKVFLMRLGALRRGVPVAAVLMSVLWSAPASAIDLSERLAPFVESSCIDCHDADTETRLDLTSLGGDPSDEVALRVWEKVFDRIDRGEMPPSDADQPSKEERREILDVLQKHLHDASLKQQQIHGRVPSRRLTRQEYEYTLHDLLGIGGNYAKHLPPENESASFDVVAANQEMSAVHVKGLLRAADLALYEAIQLGKKPPMGDRKIDYLGNNYIQMWVDRPVRRGGGTVFKTDKDVVTFRGENFVFRSDANGFLPPVAGNYLITVKAAAHQPRSSVSVSMKRQNDNQGDSALLAAWDLVGSDYREVSVEAYLRPDDYIYVSADELEPAPNGGIIYNSQPASAFGGEGVKIRHVSVKGPLESAWPPQRTRDLFPGIEWTDESETKTWYRIYEPILSQTPIEHVRASIASLGRSAFRREVTSDEVDEFVALAKPVLDSSGDLVAATRIPLRAILVSPELVFQTGDPGQLKPADLASRLASFLWRSIPDDELLEAAAEGKLSNDDELKKHVNRMVKDRKFRRFVNSFLDQWLDLDHIDATTPDTYLYPEYDDLLRAAMLAETREFFAHLIEQDLSVSQLIDSDFTFLNRKLAEHYGIEGVVGEEFRKVRLPAGSVRGGILSHASIAKVTANGTVTTPVKRGSFVLANLLGLPPSPPPPNVGSIEPDTRGATTIRETLKKHQAVAQCAACHRHIDPPGFALECFDPIGNYRKQYRNSKGIRREVNVGLRFLHKEYDLGLDVDSSGETVDGDEFDGIRQYKQHLLKSQEQVARNLLSNLIAFSTGGEVQFADREVVRKILADTKEDGYPIRTMIHQVINSRMFRNR